MKFYYVTFRSVTHGQRGEKLLKQEGIRCHLLRTPKWMEVKGCGYSLRLRGERTGEAIRLLQERKIPFRKVYRTGQDGKVEEITL